VSAGGLLLVPLHDVGRSGLGVARVLTRVASTLTLMEQVEAAIELDLDLRQALAPSLVEARSVGGGRVEVLLLARQRVDLVEDVGVGDLGFPLYMSSSAIESSSSSWPR
jgi:hypothetical protein